ncbi:HepT-like ribonuclease domain-containing protein [Leptospira sp. WS39.C2]
MIEDILKAIDEFFEFVNDVTDLNQYDNDVLRKRDVERILEIIGEVVKKIPDSMRESS